MEPNLQADPLAAVSWARARDEARLGLYVHVPFCARRCSYCDFSTGLLSSAAVERYLAAMEREAERWSANARGLRFTSAFFGGGTPSALAARSFVRLWSALRSRFDLAPDAEVTLEANPESVRPALLEAWAAAGVNRLSFGAQSFVPEELNELGRIHDADRPAEAVRLARAHGFERLSIDLMFGFPGNDAERLRRSVDAALELSLEHLSVYCFIPEPGTPLGDAVRRGACALPSPEEQADAYAWITERLEAAGYRCYETSNFCRSGGEARHNLVYWLRRPYLGLGPSAHGLMHGFRYGNHYALERWASALEAGAAPHDEVEVEDAERTALEVMMLGLRLSDGLVARDHDPAAWAAVERRYGESFARAVATGRLECSGGAVRVPRALRFVADDVIARIEADAESRRERASAAPPAAAREPRVLTASRAAS